jgi:hypothetical protein
MQQQKLGIPIFGLFFENSTVPAARAALFV